MTTNNVASITGKGPASPKSKRPQVPDITRAVGEQQERLWTLLTLIQCVRAKSDDADFGKDSLGWAMGGLADLADSIHLALDIDALRKRAREFEHEDALEQRFEVEGRPNASD